MRTLHKCQALWAWWLGHKICSVVSNQPAWWRWMATVKRMGIKKSQFLLAKICLATLSSYHYCIFGLLRPLPCTQLDCGLEHRTGIYSLKQFWNLPARPHTKAYRHYRKENNCIFFVNSVNLPSRSLAKNSHWMKLDGKRKLITPVEFNILLGNV